MSGGEPDPMPASPMSAMAMSAVHLHEMYRSFVSAGFTAEQAFQFVLATWTEGLKRNGNGE